VLNALKLQRDVIDAEWVADIEHDRARHKLK
jgi:hypothetical protein